MLLWYNLNMANVERNASIQAKTKKKKRQYIFNIFIVFIAAILVGYFALKDDYQAVLSSIAQADWKFAVITVFVLFLFYAIDGLIIFVFARLYTTRYAWHRGLTVSFIGKFYESISPTRNGKFAQVSTLRKQQIKVSSAASMIIMYMILSQIVKLGIGLFAMIFHFESLVRNASPIVIGSLKIPVSIFALMGFILNALIITTLFLMAYSKKLHDFIINTIITIGTKLKIIKYPEESRAKLKVGTDNFRVELKRLQLNIRVTVLIVILFILKYICLYSIPYLIGSSLVNAPLVDAANNSFYFNSLSMNAFLEMITKLIPLPGGAGISEYTFVRVYQDMFTTAGIVAGTANPERLVYSGQILWRFFTFYFGLIVGAFVSAFYRSRLEDESDAEFAAKSFHEIQSETLSEREQTSMINELSKKEIKQRLKQRRRNKRNQNKNINQDDD